MIQDAPRTEKGITIQEAKKPQEEEIKKPVEPENATKKEYKITKGFALPPETEETAKPQVSLELAKEEKEPQAPKGKKKVKVKKSVKKPEQTGNE